MEDQDRVVLGCVDGSPLSDAVADYSGWIAARIQRPLTFLNTIERDKQEPRTDMTGNIGLGARDDLLEALASEDNETSKLRIAAGKEALERARQRAAVFGATAQVLQRHGKLYENVIELRDAMRVLVLGLRGEDTQSAEDRVGSQVEVIIRSLSEPILLVTEDFAPPRSVLLAYDGSQKSRKALEMVATSPLFKTLPCHVVHVGTQENRSQELLSNAAKSLQQTGVDASFAALQSDDVVTALLNYQAEHDVDMIVMGAFSKNRLRTTLFGSFTATMISRTRKSLLLLR
ncbi:universal stress protein [Desulfurispira natronophila]|uniref:Nucleotide-binding universal stress UspA family protein n=1 Tax=Desulfurispira natronophila TaxID=682562 RepID=A0A7W7Y5U8_9BACT|nr:universal stress protein [Desulfurispira natronophila]MBB5022537.1 nucleotide-binding universal stress UspA family protein [Desulfurispira natronophila]